MFQDAGALFKPGFGGFKPRLKFLTFGLCILKLLKYKCVKNCNQTCWLHVLLRLERIYCFLSAFVKKNKNSNFDHN